MTNEANSAPAASDKKLSIKVLGVGGAGCNAVAHLARESLDGVSLAVLNTDAAALTQSPVPERLVLGAKTTRGLGAGGDPERGRAAAEEEAVQIRSLCDGANLVFVLAGMGGGTGTGAGPVVARIAKETGALVLGVVVTPFDCEGGRRARQAQLGLQALKRVADGVICLPNQKVLKFIDEKTPLLEAFAITNEFVAQGVRGIWRLLTRPGLINVDFADLCAVTKGRHTESSLATAEARGEHRAREVMEKLLAHPLIEGGQVLGESDAVLVCIAGGPELTMADVNRIMEQVNRQCEGAHLILGAAIDTALADTLSVTLVASCGAGRDNASKTETAGDAVIVSEFDEPGETSRPPSRFVAPPPASTPEKTAELLANQPGSRGRKKNSRMKQGQLPLEIISKGRFEKSEPTIHRGEDLDVPTYIRRGVALN